VYLRRIVAAHERIRQTQAHLDTLLDHSPDPMLCVARNGTIVRTNQMAEKFFGYSSFDLLTMTVEQLIPERFRTAHIEQRQGFFAHPENRPMGGKAVLSALTRDGREPNVEISLSYTGEGEKRLSTITIRDVTEQERNRVALVDARQRAEDNLARQRDMQNDLVQAEKMAALGGLVAGVAHEVNTPVGVTLSSATHLEAETRKADALYQAGELTEDGLTDYFATARQAARLMTINSQRASDLIQSFKQVAVDQTGGERRKFNLATYLDEILLSLRPRLKKAPVKVAVACPRDLFVDGFPGALSQVLSNLIMNSLTHAFDPEQAGHIDILARLADAAGEWIEIVYRDDGRGIPPELHTQVFEPFFTTRRGKGGSGLGLHIVSNILRQTLKGTLELDSATGQGTAFTLRFPQNLPR
ncbi:MAG: PAS domain-containing sensor histidine kinase, partial [Pseudomonadota bacterium]